VNIDSHVHPELINHRFAYVSVSRAAQDAQLFTNDASSLATNLSHAVTKASAIEVGLGLGIWKSAGVTENETLIVVFSGLST
jgi:hypothetical protein